MILRFVQTDRQPHPRYEFYLKKDSIAKCDVPSSDQIYIRYDEKELFLDLNGVKKDLGDGKKKSVIEVKQESDVIAHIFQDAVVLKKVLFVPIGYGFISIKMKDITYKCYEVGLGAEQHYFCILQGDKTVAMFHKDDVVRNKRDTYTIYADDEIPLEVILALGMYIDCTRFPDIGEVSGVGSDNNSYYSSQLELREKYDPEFIPYILSKDN